MSYLPPDSLKANASLNPLNDLPTNGILLFMIGETSFSVGTNAISVVELMVLLTTFLSFVKLEIKTPMVSKMVKNIVFFII